MEKSLVCEAQYLFPTANLAYTNLAYTQVRIAPESVAGAFGARLAW